MTISPDERLACPPDVLSRVLDGEAVLLDLKNGGYFGLNDVGTRAWELVAKRGLNFGELIEALLAEFDVSKEQLLEDLPPFIEALERAGLVVRTAS